VRVREIGITRLFGIFDHCIPMNMDDHLTIIHGPNGFGKTALLRMLNGVFNGRYSELRSIPFSTFRIDLDDGSTLRVSRVTDQSKRKRNAVQLRFVFSKPNSEDQVFTPQTAQERRELEFPLQYIERAIPDVQRIGSEAWQVVPTGEILSLDDILERYSESLPFRGAHAEGKPAVPDWLKEIRDSIHVRFIVAQRLLSPTSSRRTPEYERGPSMRPAVEVYSDELASAIKSKLTESATLSQSLDRTFPGRLVSQGLTSDLSVEELRDSLAQLEQKRSRLMEAGLLDKEGDLEFQPPRQVDERTKSVLSVYVEDVEKKLGVFDDLANKIDLLNKIVTNRFLYKRMGINKEKGFYFTSRDEAPLPLESLSSGEQHELVLFYQLLFRVEPNSLILIDEPELSLHVAWQVEFLKDLQEIINLAHFDALIATHSPQIINDRWDLTVKLEGPN
jgi:predicted ATP-binding protein involved in virulence